MQNQKSKVKMYQPKRTISICPLEVAPHVPGTRRRRSDPGGARENIRVPAEMALCFTGSGVLFQ